MNEICTDNRFDLIAKYKQDLLNGTNIETSPDEMAVIDNILFRFWQMGWLLPTPRTNADYIRTMTNEELAVFFKSSCRAIITKSYVCDYYTEWADTDCNKCWLDWLNQEIQK